MEATPPPADIDPELLKALQPVAESVTRFVVETQKPPGDVALLVVHAESRGFFGPMPETMGEPVSGVPYRAAVTNARVLAGRMLAAGKLALAEQLLQPLQAPQVAFFVIVGLESYHAGVLGATYEPVDPPASDEDAR